MYDGNKDDYDDNDAGNDDDDYIDDDTTNQAFGGNILYFPVLNIRSKEQKLTLFNFRISLGYCGNFNRWSCQKKSSANFK